MGVDGVKQKVTTGTGGTAALAEPKKVEAKKLPAEVQVATRPAEGFDLAKKKLMSVSGRFAAHKPNVPIREDLKEMVSGQRMAVNAGGAQSGGAPVASGAKAEAGHVHGAACGCGPTLKNGTLNTASNLGAAPGPRTPASDFEGEAKKANPKATPAELDAIANKSARAALEKDFGVKVKDGDKQWTTEDLSRAHESFSQMPAGDQQKLKGLDLIRNAKASAKSQAEMGSKGTIAGEYMPNVTTTDGVRDKPGAIQLYDGAFPATPDGRKQSMHVIIHEAGHAVEGRASNDALVALNGATDKSNKAADDLNPKIVANGAQWGAKPKGDRQYPAGTTNRAMEDFGSVPGADKPAMAFVGTQNAVTAAVVKLQNAKTPADLDTAQTNLDAAKTKRDAAMKGMSGNAKESEASDWVAATDKQEVTARAKADSNVKYLPLKADTDQTMKDLKAVSTLTAIVDDAGKSTQTTKSNELQAFEKVKKKEAAVSGYGESKAPEGYAEAYALYQRDPKKLKEVAPLQYKFFHDKHKNVND